LLGFGREWGCGAKKEYRLRKDAGRFTIFWQQKMCKTPLFFLAKYGKMVV
jgi:hypothetical protein